MSSNKSFSTETSERYARALFELVSESSELEMVERNIKELLHVYDSNKELENFIKNPTHSFSDQLKIINRLSHIMNFSKILNNFLSMGGYAVYVWSAYSISFIVLFLNIIIAIRNEHKTLNEIKERLQNNKK